MVEETSQKPSSFQEWLATIKDPEERTKIIESKNKTAYWFYDEREHQTLPGQEITDTQTAENIVRSEWEKSHHK